VANEVTRNSNAMLVLFVLCINPLGVYHNGG